ncbi:MAG TPA: hypothetical protein PKK37_04185, partial [Candidatus Pacearchaeota archaeon]|nr:hypothetical protein [Candidatus Pacearchaeota archaeon]
YYQQNCLLSLAASLARDFFLIATAQTPLYSLPLNMKIGQKASARVLTQTAVDIQCGYNVD